MKTVPLEPVAGRSAILSSPFVARPGLRANRILTTLAGLAALLSSPISSAAPGDFDSSFGVGGLVTTDFFGNADNATAIAAQTDSKIVVAGWTQSGSDITTADFAVARYLPDGTLDSAFGTGGMVTSDFAGSTDFGHAVAIQSDGKIIVAGEALNGAQKSFCPDPL